MTLQEHPLLGMALFVAGGTSLVMALLLLAALMGPAGWGLLALAALTSCGYLLGGKSC